MIIFIVTLCLITCTIFWHVYKRFNKKSTGNYGLTDERVEVYEYTFRKNPELGYIATDKLNGHSPYYIPSKHTVKTYGAQQREARKRRK